MTPGQRITGSEYFAHPPVGTGDWTFGLDSVTVDDIPEFVGSVSGIAIPTQ